MGRLHVVGWGPVAYIYRYIRTQTTQQLAGRVAAASSGTNATSTEQDGRLIRLRQRLVESAPVYAAVNLEALILASSSSAASSH